MAPSESVSSGIAGFDDILGGGWPAGQIYLVLGLPGAGKTTLGLQFLLDGAAKGERVLYVTLSETLVEIQHVFAAHGWSMDGVEVFELGQAHDALGLGDPPTMFDPSDVEFRETTRALREQIDRVAPRRVVFDSLAELALLARDNLAFRRELLMLKQILIERGTTALLLSDTTTPDADRQLQSLCHGVLNMDDLAPEYGTERRRLRLRKLRGRRYRGGYHDFRIDRGGVTVFPRLIAAEHGEPFSKEPLRTGIAHLDRMLGGGLPRGGSALLMGPAGSGKSCLVSHFAAALAKDGQPASVFLFDEVVDSFVSRAEGLGLDLQAHIDSGLLEVRQVDPAQLSPGEFVHLVRTAVEERGARMIAIDSLNGYMHAMPEERFLTVQMHELLTYLNQMGVMAVLVLAQAGMIGNMTTPADLTYIADSVILTRFFEAGGEVRRAISILKKRRGPHEMAIRELRIGVEGLQVGKPLSTFRGVLSGVPTFTGEVSTLFEPEDDAGLHAGA